jgi:hypothetical protein
MPMTTLRNRLFLEGILLGGMCGLAVGSLIAFQIGGGRIPNVRRFIFERTTEPAPAYKHLRV